MATTEYILSSDYLYERSGDIYTVYSFFNTYNYTNQESSSSYALPFATMTFKPRLDDVENFLSRKKIVWDFGDGTIYETVTARHAYKNAGRYKVTCYLYDRLGNSYYDSFAQNVDIYNFIPDSITINYPTRTTCLTAGRITNPIIITRSTSFQAFERGSPNLSIIPYASGGIERTNYFDSNTYKESYDHLYPYSSFYILMSGLYNKTEFVEVSSFETTSVPIYCRLSGISIIPCARSERGSFFCGTTGIQNVYFKSDLPTSCVNLLFGMQPNTLRAFSNTTTVGVSACIVSNNDIHHLSITSNGLDNEGKTSSLFPISKNKFSNTDISFVIKVKDSEDFTVKSVPILADINIVLTDGTITYPATFKSSFDSLSNLNYGGFYKGVLTFDTDELISNVYIAASATVQGRQITGQSNYFNIYPAAGIYNFAKHGEDIDFTQTFKDISLQALFLNNHNLYNEFLQCVFGTLSSDYTTLGKSTYEKIKNFVSNNSTLDYANINNLIALFGEYNISDIKFNSLNYRYPVGVSRLVDLLSINHSKLFGTQNKFNEDFKTYGYQNSDIFGKNLGSEITISQTITAGPNIIAFERFGGGYKLINTYLPLSSQNVTSNTYQIKDYEDSWGWGLVLPSDGYGESIANYYLFYQHIPTIEGTVRDGIINFNDITTTLSFNNSSYTAWSEAEGIMSNLLSNQLYKGLGLIK